MGPFEDEKKDLRESFDQMEKVFVDEEEATVEQKQMYEKIIKRECVELEESVKGVEEERREKEAAAAGAAAAAACDKMAAEAEKLNRACEIETNELMAECQRWREIKED